MSPATVRRLLVFGVCLAGVGCLYLVPSMAGPSQRTGSPATRDLPTAGWTAAAGVSVTAATLAPESTGDLIPRQTSWRGSVPSSAATRGDDRQPAATRAAATANPPGRDDNPPDPVGRLSVVGSDQARLTVAWPEATDDVGVAGYQVLLNGFLVLVTHQPRATLAWFNDSNTHVIQVRALDGAGNIGPPSPTLLVSRPAPDPEPTASALPSDAPTPTTEPTGSVTPTLTGVADGTIDTNDAAPSPTSQESRTEEDGS
jgi:hypothetical protein